MEKSATLADAFGSLVDRRFVDSLIATIRMLEIESAPHPNRLVSVKEAARLLGRSDNAVRQLERKGKIKAARPDGRVMFALADVLEFHRAK